MGHLKTRKTHIVRQLLAFATALVAAALVWPGRVSSLPLFSAISPAVLVASDVDYAPGQILVKLRQGSSPHRLLDREAGQQVELLAEMPAFDVALLQVSAGQEQLIAAMLRQDPGVEYVELNHRVHALEVPGDPMWPQQWALSKIVAAQAWDLGHCQGVVIAVLDSGVELQHPDLRNVLWTNVREVPANGIDDDQNGHVDDVHGWHFYQDCTATGCQPAEDQDIQDNNGHGTHVAGIAAAETDNAIGIAGVSWGARLMTVKVLNAEGDGYYSDIAEAMRYATDNGAKVINLSFGGDEASQLLQDAVDYAHERGVLLVAAAGNDRGAVDYPAACENVMAVAATDSSDHQASFSSRGPEVDIAAPGYGIVSTWLLPLEYLSRSGTSMSAAHVSGAAALLWSLHPESSNDEIQATLQSYADDVNADSDPGRDYSLGWGRLNLYRAAARLPANPTPTPPVTRYFCYVLFPWPIRSVP